MKSIFTPFFRLLGILGLLFFLPQGAKAQCSISVSSQNNPLCTLVANGDITVSMANSVNFNLMPGNISSINGFFNNLMAGNYTITGTDIGSCSSSTVVTLTDPPTITFFPTSYILPACFGMTATITTSAVGGTGGITYSLLPAVQPSNTTGIFTNLTATATYTVVATDANGCSISTVALVTQPTQVNITTASYTPPLCNSASNGTITVGANGGTGTITYCLAPNVQPCNTTGNFTGIAAGAYTVVATDVNGCSSMTLVSVTQPPFMSLTISSVTGTICGQPYSGTITPQLTGGVPPYTYSIFPNIGPYQNGIFTNLTSTNYTITGTDANGCTVSTTAFVPSTPSPTMQLTNFVNTSCPGVCNGSMNYTAVSGTPPYTFTINPAVPFGGGVVNNLCNGIYTMTVMDANGCTGFMTHNFNGQSGLGFSNTVTPVSCGTNCTGSIVPQATGGNAPYTYSINGNQYNNLCVGNYTLTATDANTCTNTTVIQLLTSTTNQFIYPNATVGAGSISAAPTGGTAPYQYSLNGGPYTTNNTFSLLCSGTYTLTVKDNYFNGCLKDTVITIQAANAFPGVTFNVSTIQPSCPMSQNGSIQLIPVPGGTYTYTWSNSATGSTISNLNAGTYSVTITNAANECIDMSIPLTALGNNCGDISGVVYYDNNTNCTQDLLEVGIPGTMITANPGNHITFTDATGHYSFLGLPYGTYTLTHANNVNAFATACGNNPTLTISNAQATATQNFGDTNTIHLDYQVWVNNPNCFNIAAPLKFKVIRYQLNNPTISSTGTVYAVFDSIQHFLSANPVPTSVNGNVVSWNLNNITDTTGAIWVYFTLPNNFTAANTVPFTVGINNLQYPDTNILNNQINYTFPICNGYDPNDKSVAPKGIGPTGLITLDQSLLTYTVRFQNTGNAPAYNIVVVDTLSDNLDITSFNITEVSHNYQLEVVDNKILKWKFYNIMLPDSTSNFAGSIGHIIYQLRMKNGLQLGDQIKNKAYIYFDYNPAIITNETVNTIYQPSIVSNWQSGETVIYPNPSEGVLYIDAELAFTQYRLMDASMRIIKQARFSATRQQQVDVRGVSSGVYFLQVGEGRLKKVVVK